MPTDLHVDPTTVTGYHHRTIVAAWGEAPGAVTLTVVHDGRFEFRAALVGPRFEVLELPRGLGEDNTDDATGHLAAVVAMVRWCVDHPGPYHDEIRGLLDRAAA